MEAKQPGSASTLLNDILEKAVKVNASDIHVEPCQNNIRIRYRVDGALESGITIHRSMHAQLTSRIKIISDLDTSESRKPQDGRAFFKIGNRDFDIRVSSIPTINGEKTVLRLLERDSKLLQLEDIGLTKEQLSGIFASLSEPHGLILVCGPTGCGKTTTLYACLEKLDKQKLNIITIEDPVEYQLPGITQIQVNNKTGLSFALGLRSILRQDPDVILIGEIRDEETARIAIQASLTGHLVLSTVHTNSAKQASTRLMDMGIEGYLIRDTLKCVISQRLTRKPCENCLGKGCKVCGFSGFQGRTGIFEIINH